MKLQKAYAAVIALIVSVSYVPKAHAQFYEIEMPRLRNEVSLGYSYMPSYNSWPGLQHMLSTDYMFEQTRFYGSVQASFKTMLNPRLAVTATLAQTRFSGKWYTARNTNSKLDMTTTATSVMMGLKYLWVRRDMFQLYSRGDVGMAFVSSRRTDRQGSKNTESTTSYAISLAPVGVMYGYSWAVYAELTLGTLGFFHAGVAYRW